jgi:hypothetical protein
MVTTKFSVLNLNPFALKDYMNNYLSKMIKEQASSETKASGLALIYSAEDLSLKLTSKKLACFR